jgi:uncharacterized protein (TIGR00369 family)
MIEQKMTFEEMLTLIKTMYEQKIPFNRVLGMKIATLAPDDVRVRFKMKAELIGNYIHGFLHGGAISAVLDATGGMNASIGILKKLEHRPPEEIADRLARVGTIDLRVDFLRPGVGLDFVATSTIMRSGKRVAVTRMELHNDQNVLIAVGTGTYIVG